MLFNNVSNSNSDAIDLHRCVAFGDFILDFDRGCLQRDGTDVPLRPKSFEVLVYLVRHHGVLINKAELLDAVWPKVVVTEDSLTQCLIEIRKALGDTDRQMIVTVPRRGYLFDMSVTRIRTGGNSSNHQKNSWFTPRSPVFWSAAVTLLLTLLVTIGWQQPADNGSGGARVLTPFKPSFIPSTANQHYEQGRFFYNRRISGDLDRAVLEYRKALAIDPEMAQAWVGLGAVYYLKAWDSGSVDGEEYVNYLKHALELDPNNPEANMRMSNYYYFHGNPTKDAEHLAIALKYGQQDPLVLSMAAGDLMYQLKIDEALTLQRRAVELAPTSILLHEGLATFYFFAGRVEEAKDEYNLLMELSPESKSQIALSMFKVALSQLDMPEAELWSRQVDEDSPDFRVTSAILASLTGDQAEAEKNIETLLASSTSLAAIKLAEFYAYVEDQETSFKWLDEALVRLQNSPDSMRACRILAEAYYSPFLNSIRNQPKWFDWQRELALITPRDSSINVAALVLSD